MSFDFINYIILIWKEEFKKLKGIDYYEDKKDRKAVGLLLAKFKKKNKDTNSEDMLEIFRTYFRDVLQIQDPWYSKNMTLSLLNSKINEIYQHVLDLRRVRKQQKGDRETAEDLKRVGKLYEKEVGGAFKPWPERESNYKPPFMTRLQFLREFGAPRINEFNDYEKKMADEI